MPIFFPTLADWRAWLALHHSEEKELTVGFYKRGCGKPSITWPESVDGALCFGWIDGVRRRIDEESYSIRFTPRQVKSNWSVVNINRVAELTELGLMQASGLKAFQARVEERSGVYAFEQETVRLSDPHESRFRKNEPAWAFFAKQPNWYQKTATWWVISAKQEVTRDRRLTTLIEDSENGRTIRQLTRK